MRQAQSWARRLGLGGEFVNEALEDKALVGRRRAELEIGAGDKAQGAGEFAAALVAARLADEIVGGEGRHAEALPQRLPDGARVAHVLLEDHEHLAEGAGEHVEVADGGVFASVGAVEQALQQGERADAVAGADRVSELVERALLGGEDHGFDVAEGDAATAEGVEQKLLEFGGDEHHVCAQRVDQLVRGVGLQADVGLLCRGDGPAHCVFLVDACQLDHAAVRAQRFGQALVAVLVVEFHAARIGGDAEEVGDEEEQRLRIGRAEVALERGEFFFLGAARVELPHVANKDDLEWRHERRRLRAVENFKDGGLGEIEVGEAEVAEIGGTKALMTAARQRSRRKISSPART